ncbi:MAG: DUF5615 family PIN-like protein [Saprospiraceae bacterium]
MKRMLLDENLPRPLKKHFSSDFDITTVPDLGWQSKKDTALLEAMMQEGIEVLITADRNLQFQQNFEKYPIHLVVLLSYDNRYKTLINKVAEIEHHLRQISDQNKLTIIDLR